MPDTYKLKYVNDTLTRDVSTATLPIALVVPDYPTGTYTRTLYQNTFSTGDGRFNDCIYNYDLLRITTMPQDPTANKLAAPNPPFYVEPEWLRNHTIHTQTFGYDNTAAVNTIGNFIWADSRFSASPDGMSFISTRHGNSFRADSNWNQTGTPINGNSASYLNYMWNVMQVDGIVYNGNRELLYSGSDGASAVTLSKSITGNGYSVIQVKCGIQNTDNQDGIYIDELTPYRTTATRDSLQFPMGAAGNWYNCMTVSKWSNDFKTLTTSAAKAFMKPLTTTGVMTGNTSYNNQLRKSIYAVWGVK